MIRIILPLFLALFFSANVHAAVELQLAGDKTPVLIRSVYLREGTVFLPLREVLPPLHLSGVWDTAKHLYRVETASGELLFAPGSRKLRLGKQSAQLKQAPRFFDGELCIPEEVVTIHLPLLLQLKISYLNKDAVLPEKKESFSGKGAEVVSSPPLLLQQIVIDPGHGGDDPGAINPSGVKEKDITLAIALQLEKMIKMEGFAPILLTRDGDYGVSLQKRSGIIRGNADENLLLSLHAGAWRSPETGGCTLYLLPLPEGGEQREDLSLLLAQSLGESLDAAGVKDCSIERFPLFPLNKTPFPAVLLELGYLTNPFELMQLASGDGQERIARALASGVKKYAETRQRRKMDVPITQ